jgi:hypothetical protein
MTLAAPELRKLYLKVIRRVHPDGAIDEQDRLRCERLTQEANHAYEVGDEAALRAVLEPKPPRSGWSPRWPAGRRFRLRWNSLKIQPWQVAGGAIACALVCCYILITLRPPKTADTMRSQVVTHQPQNDTKASMTNIPAPPVMAGKPARQSASAYRDRNADRRVPSQDLPGLNRYLETVGSEVEKNFKQQTLDAPDGTSADIAVVIRGDGEPEEPHLMMPSGYAGVDSACLQSVEQIHSFGATPTGQNMTVNCQCVVRAR